MILTQSYSHTYSIVARDAQTGQLGVAVQSHYFCVGGLVTWAEAGVGAVATQAMVEPSYGPLGLDLMRSGKSAQEALAALLAADKGREIRQVAMVDASGCAVAHTGASTIAEAGHLTGTGFSVQANMMLRRTVWPAMAEAYAAANGELVDKLMAALDAAENEGGDIRGRQSAALLVVGPRSSGYPWADKLFDLRVDDAPEPLVELRRLADVSRAYECQRYGQRALERGEEGAPAEFERAAKLIGDNPEMRFWQAIALMRSGRIDDGLAILGPIVKREPNWKELALRLSEFMLPRDEALGERIRSLS